jgi:hypothetical protein
MATVRAAGSPVAARQIGDALGMDTRGRDKLGQTDRSARTAGRNQRTPGGCWNRVTNANEHAGAPCPCVRVPPAAVHAHRALPRRSAARPREVDRGPRVGHRRPGGSLSSCRPCCCTIGAGPTWPAATTPTLIPTQRRTRDSEPAELLRRTPPPGPALPHPHPDQLLQEGRSRKPDRRLRESHIRCGTAPSCQR